jgi:hypothetical protein
VGRGFESRLRLLPESLREHGFVGPWLELAKHIDILDEKITTLDVKIDDLRSALARVEALVRGLTNA